MHSLFSVDEMRGMKWHKSFSFTKGCPVMQIPEKAWRNSYDFGNLLYDIDRDPQQQNPLQDSKLEQMMIDLPEESPVEAREEEREDQAPPWRDEALYRYEEGVLTSAGQELKQEPAALQPSFEIPEPAQIAAALKNAVNYRDKLGTTAQLLGQITASALGIAFSGTDAATSRRRIKFSEADRSVLIYGVVPALVYPTHLQPPGEEDKLPAPPLSVDLMPEFYFNAKNPVIAGLLADMDSRPERLYALAVILFNELNRMVSFKLSERALGLNRAILHAVLGVGETEPLSLKEIMKKRRKS